MQVSMQHPDRPALKAVAIPFLTRILDAPTLGGVELPAGVKGYVYIDGRPRALANGSWELQDDIVYLARSGARVDPFMKLGILGAVANMTGAIEDPAIVSKLSGRLAQAVQESTVSTYGAIMRVDSARPTRIAIDQPGARVAAELHGAWHLSSGAPVEVDDKWIIMDF